MRILKCLLIVGFFVLAALPARAQNDPNTGLPMNELLPTPPGHSTAYEPAHQISAGPGFISNLTISFHTAAYRTLMLFDSASTVAPGTVSPTWCFEGITQSTDSAESFKSMSFVGQPIKYSAGLYAALSTSTSGCTTLTLDGNNDWFTWQPITAVR